MKTIAEVAAYLSSNKISFKCNQGQEIYILKNYGILNKCQVCVDGEGVLKFYNTFLEELEFNLEIF